MQQKDKHIGPNDSPYLIGKEGDMLDREKILKVLNDLPEEFTLDELIDRLVLIEKVEQGLVDEAEGKTLTMSEAEERLKKWLK